MFCSYKNAGVDTLKLTFSWICAVAPTVYILSTFSDSDSMSIEMMIGNIKSALQICGMGCPMTTCVRVFLASLFWNIQKSHLWL